MKIVLTGSLGHIGRPLTERLVAASHSVAVISSSPERANQIQSLGAKAAIGNLDDLDFLTRTFQKADVAYLMIPPNYFSEPDLVAYYRRLGEKYAQAAQQARVKRLIHLSSFGAHLPIGTGPILGSHHVEKILDGLVGVQVTHMRPCYFYYNLESFRETIRSSGKLFANYGEDKFPMVSPQDIATAIAQEIEHSTGSIRYVASAEHDGNEIARILGVALGRTDLEWQSVTDEQALEGMKKSGLPPSMANQLVDLYRSLRTGALAEDFYRNPPERWGEVRLEDYAVEFAAGGCEVISEIENA